MAITITNNHKFFKNNDSLSIIFKDLEEDKITLKKESDFVLIFSNNKIVGINILDYKKYFLVKDGFHKISDEVRKKLLEKFNDYLSESDFDLFYQIGLVKEIQKHPASDKLKVLKVEFKNNLERQIITNVQDVQQNRKYLFATPGSITFSGKRIIESKVMNVLSSGMIMSYKSLGIEKDGIIDCSNMSLDDEYVF